MNRYGCGCMVSVPHLANGQPFTTYTVACGGYLAGYLVQCDDCQESKPCPRELRADPEDADAQAELAAELVRESGGRLQ